MQWIVIKTFSFPYEAQIAKTQLEVFGIPVYIENEHTINMDWFYSNALGGVCLLFQKTMLMKRSHFLKKTLVMSLNKSLGRVKNVALSVEVWI